MAPRRGWVRLKRGGYTSRRAWYADYQRYLASPTWMAFRRGWFERHPRAGCHVCKKSRTATHLELHHLHYDRVGRELDSDVVPVCRTCHKRIHRLARTHGISIRKATAEAKRTYQSGRQPRSA